MRRRPYEDILTREGAEFRIFWIVVFIGASHFYVDASEPHLSEGSMSVVRFMVGTAIAAASGAFEMYKARRGRW